MTCKETHDNDEQAVVNNILSLMNTETLQKLNTYLNQAPESSQTAYESGMGGGFAPVLQLLEELIL